MQTMIEETPVAAKTRELCQTILDQPGMKSLRKRIDAFMEDEPTRALLDSLMAKGQGLQQKEQTSQPLSSEEMGDFEQHRQAVMANSVARDFLDAQEEMHQIQETINRYVSKTLELGHVPTEEELSEGGSCGHGCGCHH